MYQFSFLVKLAIHKHFVLGVNTRECRRRGVTLVGRKTFGTSTENYSKYIHNLILNTCIGKRIQNSVFFKENGHGVARSICVVVIVF